MFIKNKYYKWYFALMKKSQERGLVDVLSEKHHIIPKCMGGSNKKNNKVDLTLREHYIAHLLLPKFVSSSADRSKMIYAFFRFGGRKTESRTTSKMYKRMRKVYTKSVSGKGNPFYGKRHTTETLRKISGKNHHMYGKKHTEESISKMQVNTIKRFGADNPLFGIPRTEKQKKVQSLKISGRISLTKNGIVKRIGGNKYHKLISEGWVTVKKKVQKEKFIVYFNNGRTDKAQKLIDLCRRYNWNYNTIRSNGICRGRYPSGVKSIERFKS